MSLGDKAAVAIRQSESGRTLVSVAFERLRADILSCKHPPGQKLPFLKLKQAYGVGLSPLREALSRLVASGLVTADEQRGFRVAQASIADITDIAMVRKETEGLALAKSIEFGDDNWEAEIVAARHRLALLEKGSSKDVEDEEVWEARHREFHTALISACHSPWLMRIAGLVNDQFDRYRRMAVDNSLSGTPTSLEHQKIMEAALKRDADAAVQLLREHIDDARALIVESAAEFIDR